MRGRIGIVPSGEVPVVAGDDGVLLSHLHVLPVPLPDAGPTGVGQDHTPDLRQGLVLQEGGGRALSMTRASVNGYMEIICIIESGVGPRDPRMGYGVWARGVIK